MLPPVTQGKALHDVFHWVWLPKAPSNAAAEAASDAGGSHVEFADLSTISGASFVTSEAMHPSYFVGTSPKGMLAVVVCAPSRPLGFSGVG